MPTLEVPEECELAVVAFGSAARIAKSAVDRANEEGRRVGLVRPDHPVALPRRRS